VLDIVLGLRHSDRQGDRRARPRQLPSSVVRDDPSIRDRQAHEDAAPAAPPSSLGFTDVEVDGDRGNIAIVVRRAFGGPGIGSELVGADEFGAVFRLWDA
jgi:hypothetical protein